MRKLALALLSTIPLSSIPISARAADLAPVRMPTKAPAIAQRVGDWRPVYIRTY